MQCISPLLVSCIRLIKVFILSICVFHRSEQSKEISKPPMQDQKLSLPIYEKKKLCDFCGDIFTNFAMHKCNKNFITRIKCTLCPRVLSGKDGLKRHMETIHSERPFICETCGKSYGTKKGLRAHIKRIHIKNKTVKYQCDKCDKMYISKTGLIIHDRNTHTGKGILIIKCMKLDSAKHNLHS